SGGWGPGGAGAVIAVAGAPRRIMIEVEGVPADHLRVVYNGMEPLRESAESAVAALRRQLGVGGRPVLLMVARLHEEKGHRFLFDALPALMARTGPVAVLLAGAGPPRPQLGAEVEKRGLGGGVQFLGRRGDIPELIGLASVVVLPSLAESFGFALLEAMSLGKPVVASTTGGIPEVVADGQTGLLVPQA